MPGERRVATVFGGSGFIGRYIVQRLAARSYVVRVAVRDVPGALFLQTMGRTAQIVPLYAPLNAEALVARATDGAELVINLTGSLSENRKGDFNRVHAEGAGRIARLAASSGARQLVHVSAIGADAASPSLTGKARPPARRPCAPPFRGRDPAPLDRVRRRGQVFQPFRGDGRDCSRCCPSSAGPRNSSRSMSATSPMRCWRRCRRRPREKPSSSAARRSRRSGSSLNIC